ncbi:hypothetical protein FJ955_25165 [Mesorhizobium sp. B2-2-2]|nr:hypothetical protein FJ955_25165 [Mesorhizobium sp. B2-2-2]
MGVSNAVLDELFAAETVILATGFINFNISSTLKFWVDHFARSGKSFALATTATRPRHPPRRRRPGT